MLWPLLFRIPTIQSRTGRALLHRRSWRQRHPVGRRSQRISRRVRVCSKEGRNIVGLRENRECFPFASSRGEFRGPLFHWSPVAGRGGVQESPALRGVDEHPVSPKGNPALRDGPLVFVYFEETNISMTKTKCC